MNSVKMHLWMLIFSLYLSVASSLIAPFLRDLFGIEGMYYQLLLLPTYFLPFCLLYPLVKRNLPIKPYPLKPLSGHDFIWTMILTLSFLIVFVFLNLLPGIPMRQLQSFPGYPLWLPIVALAIMGTLEVLFYQGVLYSDYRNRGISIWHTAIVIGVFATLFHMHPLQFMIVLAVQKIVSTFMIHWTKSILPAILMNVFVFIGIAMFFFYFESADNQTTLLFIFGVLSLLSIVTIYFGVKSMKARYEKLHSSDLLEVEQKSSEPPFNWVFWVLVVVWVVIYAIQFFTLTIVV